MKNNRTLWFATAALCIAAAVFIFAGRTMLSESLGDGMYSAAIVSAYVLLGGAAGSITKAFSIGPEDPSSLRNSERRDTPADH